MIKKSAYISLIIILIVGTVLAFFNTLLTRFLMDFCYIAFGWWFGYAMAGGFDK